VSWDEAFAARYDEWAAEMTEDIPFYVSLARAAGTGPVVELAVGSGRVAAPVSRGIGRTVIGIDFSPAMLEQARATGKPLVVVTMNGSPINLAWAKDNAAAILEAWYAGEAGGQAAANILTGRTNPSGRLPLTFYRSVDDLPPFGDYAMRGRTYRYFESSPVYPFGHGLSYTRFDYAPLTIEPAQAGADQGLRISTRLTNTGTRAGDEVAQLYLDFPDRPGMPRLALRGFQRVSLRPGETRNLVFDLSPRDLSSVDADGRRMVAAGRYQVTIGSGQPGTDAAGQSASFDAAQSPELPK